MVAVSSILRQMPAAMVVIAVVAERIVLDVPVPPDVFVSGVVQHPREPPGLHHHPRAIVVWGRIPEPVAEEVVSLIDKDNIIRRLNRDVES